MVTAEAGSVVRPLWWRARFWLALAAVAVVIAVGLGSLFDAPGRPLDPSSADRDGAKALARISAGYGVRVTATDSLESAQKASDRPGTTVLVAEPGSYSGAQLRSLRGASRLVLVRPSSRRLAAVVPGGEADAEDSPDESPDCDLPGPVAAGDVDWPDDAVTYLAPGGQDCYDGGVVVAGHVVAVGSASLLTNESLKGEGAAALDVNLLSADRTASEVVWLMPGADAAGDGPTGIWQLFPDGAYRVFWWLAAAGVVLVLWRARRLGGVVYEPLTVVVRAAELVEGHGRLYARAGARDRAATALRRSARRRLGDRLGLPRRAPVEQVVAAVETRADLPSGSVATLLAGPSPADDAALVRLARDLDALVDAVEGTTR